jgi:hypothetical protein
LYWFKSFAEAVTVKDLRSMLVAVISRDPVYCALWEPTERLKRYEARFIAGEQKLAKLSTNSPRRSALQHLVAQRSTSASDTIAHAALSIAGGKQ